MKSRKNKVFNIRQIAKIFCIIILVIGVIVWENTRIPEAKIRKTRHLKMIERSYEELLKYLEEAPEDITAQPYKAHLPKIVQKDIQRMLTSEEELIICYTSYTSLDKSSEIIIRRADNDENQVEIAIFGVSEFWDVFAWDEAIVDEISFYKKGDHIVIYGRGPWCPRDLITREISLRREVLTDYSDLDLCGTDYFNHYDNIWNWDEEMTLIRKGNEFKFFKSGVQQGSTTVFDGEIVEMDEHFQYILDDERNLWYMAYSSVPSNPWIHFVKVDENVSEVLDIDLSMVHVTLNTENNSSESFPVYMKNGKKYAGIKNSKIFNLSNNEPIENLNFDIEIVELSEKNIKYAEIQYKEFLEEWWAKLIYDDSPNPIYEEKKIFDTSQIPNIPEEIDLFNGIIVSWSQFGETVNELKQTYQKYEKK